MENLDHLFSKELVNTEKGHGIILLKDLKRSDERLKEKPIFSYAHFYSKKSSIICDFCFRTIGSFKDNLNHVLKLCGKSIGPVVEDKINRLKHKFPELEGSKCLKCERNCSFTFCSKDCLEKSSGIHLIPCRLMKDEEKEKWDLFKRYSLKTHENFYFAGTIYLSMLYDSLYNNKKIAFWIDKLNEFWTIPWDKLSTFGSESRNPRDLAFDSFNMIENCLKRFKEEASKDDNDVEVIFSMDFYLKLLGMMDLVCVDIEIENPLNQVLFSLNRDEDGRDLVENLSDDLICVYKIFQGIEIDKEELNRMIESADFFPETMGLGLFNYISKMNHSCEPNLEVDYRGNNTANIIPIFDLHQGQEATISYIDESNSFENRQIKLYRNYGFKCECTKCILEVLCVSKYQCLQVIKYLIMIRHIEENGSFTLDEFTQSIITDKIFNIDENEILTKLANAIKNKFANLYTNNYSNIFDRASLADSTYKSQSNIVFPSQISGNDHVSSFKSHPRVPQPSSILNWFKRDASKYETVEKKPTITECVNTQRDDEPSTSVIPIDIGIYLNINTTNYIDPFGTLIISGDMLCFSSDSESDIDFMEDNIPTSSTVISESEQVGEDDETYIETCSINNGSSGDTICSEDSKGSDFESVILEGSEEPVANDSEQSFSGSEDIPNEASNSVVCNHYLGNNVFVFYGNTNNVIGSYWVLGKVFECDLKTLFSSQDNLEYEFLIIQNKRVHHFDCKILQECLLNEVVTLVRLKEMIHTRHNKVTILENFEYLSNNWQVLVNKWMNSMHEKVFILLCNTLNPLDQRVKSFSLMFRIRGLDKQRFIDHIHKTCMKNANNNIKACLSRLNVTEIVNRVNFDIISTYNTVIDAQKNYMNAIRKHKIPYGHRLLRSLVHIIIHGKGSEMTDSSVNNLISDIFLDYGPYKLDVMLYDFYTRLIEMGSEEIVPLKYEINRLLSEVFTRNNVLYEYDENLTEQEIKMKCMKQMVNKIVSMLQDLRFNNSKT